MKIQTGRGTISPWMLISVYSVSMVISLPGLAISPILGQLETVFKDVSSLELQMLESLPSLIIIPFVLLSGRLSVGRGKKHLLIIGLGIFFLSSIAYFLADSIAYLLVVSTLLGIGAVIIIPISNGLIADFFVGKYRTHQLGISSGITNLTLVLATLLAGYLAAIGWKYAFSVYCISGIALVWAFFQKDPVSLSASSDGPDVRPSSGKSSAFRLKIPWGVMMFYFSITYLVLTIPFNLSIYLENLHIGSSKLSATLIPFFFLAITVPGFFIMKVIRLWGKNTIFFSLLSMALGLSVFLFFRNPWLLGLGCVLAGFGYGVIQPLIYDKAVSGVVSAQATFALSMVMAMNYIAILVYPFILKLLEDIFHSSSPVFAFVINMSLTFLLAGMAYYRRDSLVLGMKGE